MHKRLVIAIWVACAQAALRVNQPPTDPQPVQNVETVHWFRDEVYPLDSALKALPETLPSHRKHLIPLNEQALKFGYEYVTSHRGDLQNAGSLSLLGQGLTAAAV